MRLQPPTPNTGVGAGVHLNTKGLSERLDAGTAGLDRGPFFALSSYNGPGPREKPQRRAQKTPRESDSPPGPPADVQRAFLASRFPSRWAMGSHSECTLLALGPNSVFQGKRGGQKNDEKRGRSEYSWGAAKWIGSRQGVCLGPGCSASSC